MEVTTRQLNAFGNLLQHEHSVTTTDSIHATVLTLVRENIQTLDMPLKTGENRRLCNFIVGADRILRSKDRRDMAHLDKEGLIARAKDFWVEVGYNLKDCTCNDCRDVEHCRYAFDLYNTNGDCLAEK